MRRKGKDRGGPDSSDGWGCWVSRFARELNQGICRKFTTLAAAAGGVQSLWKTSPFFMDFSVVCRLASCFDNFI
jgi:hypothetical protein